MKHGWLEMPQSERSQIIKSLLRWLSAKSKKNGGATTSQIIRYTMQEITDLGASERTIQGYINTLDKLGLISIYRLKWKTTSQGENWLDRKKGL